MPDTNSVLRRMARLKDDIIGGFSVFALSVFLSLSGLTSQLTAAALLTFLGFPLYFKAIRRAAQSEGLLNGFGKSAGVTTVFLVPLIVWVASGAIFGGVNTFPEVIEYVIAYVQAFVIFGLAASVYYMVVRSEELKGLRFSRRMLIVTPIVVFIPSLVIVVASATLGGVV